jgi:CrcB protein
VIVLWVALGAAVGAPARYMADRAIQSRFESRFPFGTLTVNLVASFVLGIMTGLGSSASVAMAALVGTGFCGSLSTYSTFSFETMRLSENNRRTALTYVVVSVVAGCGLAALGWWVG